MYSAVYAGFSDCVIQVGRIHRSVIGLLPIGEHPFLMLLVLGPALQDLVNPIRHVDERLRIGLVAS